MASSFPSSKYVWKIENFSSLKSDRLYSDVFTSFGLKWYVLIGCIFLLDYLLLKSHMIRANFCNNKAIEYRSKGNHGTYASNIGHVTLNGTHSVIFLSCDEAAVSWYTHYRVAIIDQQDTRNYDGEGECGTRGCRVMLLTELLDPMSGFVMRDTCFIKVEILSAIKIIKPITEKALPVNEEQPRPQETDTVR